MEETFQSLPFQVDEKQLTCRVCLKYGSEFGKGLSLFEKYNDVFVFEKINYIASIEIKEGDEFPDSICSTCLLELDNACNFKEKCENSDAVLRSALSQHLPIHRQFLNIPVKSESEEDGYEYDYLDENLVSPSIALPTSEAECHTDQLIQGNYTFKSKAIDLQLECDDCGNKFKSKCKMRVHWKKLHQPKKLTCEHCKKIMRSYKAYHAHIKRRSKSCINASKLRVEGEGKSRIYHCKMCDAHSKRIQTILTHLVIHTGERPYSCNLCGMTFTQHSSVIAHKESKHKLYAKEGTCEECGKYFKGRISLYRHMKTHAEAQYPCKICSKVLKSKPILRQHMKRHSGVKSFTCEVCAKTFYTSSDLANHKSKQHMQNKIYTCDRCEYKTKNSSCMAKHRRRHSDSNVSCNVCGRFLENVQQLEMHKKRHFEKNFQCMYCSKLYYGRKNLSAHVRKKHNMYALSNSKPSILDRKKAPAPQSSS